MGSGIDTGNERAATGAGDAIMIAATPISTRICFTVFLSRSGDVRDPNRLSLRVRDNLAHRRDVPMRCRPTRSIDRWGGQHAPEPQAASAGCRSCGPGAASASDCLRHSRSLRAGACCGRHQERRARLLLPAKGAVLAHLSARHWLLSWTNRSSRPARGARTCWLLLSNGCGREARMQLALASDDPRERPARTCGRPLSPGGSRRVLPGRGRSCGSSMGSQGASAT